MGLTVVALESAASAPIAPQARRQLVVAAKVFGRRYCELLIVRKQTSGFQAAVFNTYGLNRCPAAKWAAIDPRAVATATGALVVVRNGPRYWAMDRIEKYRARREVIKDLGGLAMIQEAVVPLASLSIKPYSIHEVNRTTIFVWNKGRRVYELHGPHGSTWVMQSWSQQVDPKLGLKDLPGLGRRLKLPAGWRYSSVRLKRTLRVVTVNTAAQVMQDDFGDTYSRVSAARP